MNQLSPIDQTAAHPDALTVLSVRHWDDRLFSFCVERPASLRFRSGEFVMIGLMGENGRPIMRAYSIASPSWGDELEFYSIKVENGPLTSRLKNLAPGDKIIIRPKPVGTLVTDALTPAQRLILVATGTGFAPFASLIRDPQIYQLYSEVLVLHTVRMSSELGYAKATVDALRMNELLGEHSSQLTYYGATTREPSDNMGRCTTILDQNELEERLGIAELDPLRDRVMVCGSIALNTEMKSILEARGMTEGANSKPAEYVVEKAFVGVGV